MQQLGRERWAYLASWTIVAYTVVIILWGAWVRLSGSGDGCGDHWPLCNGVALPSAVTKKTWIEYSHRISTAVYGVLVLAQLWWTRRSLPKDNPARFWALLTLLFTITEALIGRQLVRSGLVNQSTDLARLVVMPLHLINTSLLLFAGVCTAESIRYGEKIPADTRCRDSSRWLLCLIGLVLLLTSGAIAALGSHLLPSQSLVEGLQNDLSPTSHPAVKLRILHPILGLIIPFTLVLLVGLPQTTSADSIQATWRKRTLIAFVCAVLVGVATLGFLGPVWLKLSHLLMTNLLIVIIAGFAFHSLYEQR